MKLLVVLGIAVLVVACSSGSPATPTPGTQTTPPPAQATATPGGQPTAGTPQPNTGDNQSRGRALIPSGSTQLSEISAGNAYTVQLSSDQSLEQLGAFWTQAIPAAGLQETGRFTQDGTLTIAFTNPDGGIVAIEDASTGGVIITISVGTQ